MRSVVARLIWLLQRYCKTASVTSTAVITNTTAPESRRPPKDTFIDIDALIAGN
jgi:hypothetical protein